MLKKNITVLIILLFISSALRPITLKAQFENIATTDTIIFGLSHKVGNKYTYRKISNEYTTNQWGFPLKVQKDTSYIVIRVTESLNQLRHMTIVDICTKIDSNFNSIKKDRNNLIKYKTALVMTNKWGTPYQLYNYSAYLRAIKKSLNNALKYKMIDSANYALQLKDAQDSNKISQAVFAEYNQMYSLVGKQYTVDQRYLEKMELNNPFYGPSFPATGEFFITKNYNKNIASATFDCKNDKETEKILRLSYLNMLDRYKEKSNESDRSKSIEVGHNMYAKYDYKHFMFRYYREIDYLKLGDNWRNSLVSFKLIHFENKKKKRR